MAGILQGAGGSAGNLEEDERLKGILSQYGGGEAYKNLVEGGSGGNASAALATYLTNPLLNVETSYDTEYTPYEPDPIKVDGDGESGSSEDDGEYDDLLTPSGTPMPGHPDYEDFMTGGGEGAPDSQASDGMTSAYTSITDMFDGGGPGKSGIKFEGGLLSNFLNESGAKPLGYKESALKNFEKKGTKNYSKLAKEYAAKKMKERNKEKTKEIQKQIESAMESGGDFGGQFGGDVPEYTGGYGGVSGMGGGAAGDYGSVGEAGRGGSNYSYYGSGGDVEYKRLGGVADPYGMTYKKLKIAMPKKYGPLRTSKIQTKRGGSGGVLGQAGKMATGMALKSLLGPLGALFASQGGPVGNPKYMGHGGPLGEKPMTKLEMANDMHNHKKNIMTLKTLADQGLKTEAHKIKSRSKIL